MHIGVDVGGTNTDAVLLSGSCVVASTKQPTSEDISSGITAAIEHVLSSAGVAPSRVEAVMVGTTHFTNALVERRSLDRVGVLRLASPSGEALPPMTGWPESLYRHIAAETYLLPGGFEVDGREIAALDEAQVREAARDLKAKGVNTIAVSSAFAPINAQMEQRAARIIAQEHAQARISLSHTIGRLGLIERENSTILNAALTTLAQRVVSSFERAINELGVSAPLYISQNDGTLITAERAALYPILTIGSGPTNSMRGAAFLTGLDDAIVVDVGGTTCDIGVLTKGFPRESSISADIGGVRTNYRMPDILAIGLGGGTRVHLEPALYEAAFLNADDLEIGPDSVGYRFTQDALLFGGKTLTASDIAVAAGYADFGSPSLLPQFSDHVLQSVWRRMQSIIAEGVDRMKTTPGKAPIIAVGGGHFLIADELKGASHIVRPENAGVANAVGAAIAQVGAQIERVVDYDQLSRESVMAQLREEAASRVAAAGGTAEGTQIVDIEETFLSYLPGRSAQVRLKAVSDLALPAAAGHRHSVAESRYAY